MGLTDALANKVVAAIMDPKNLNQIKSQLEDILNNYKAVVVVEYNSSTDQITSEVNFVKKSTG